MRFESDIFGNEQFTYSHHFDAARRTDVNSETEFSATKSTKYLNIACGENYVVQCDMESENYSPYEDRHVTRINVLLDLQQSQVQFGTVHCSHFIEQIQYDMAPGFPKRCYALTAPGVVIAEPQELV
jgi:hypothetical protein